MTGTRLHAGGGVQIPQVQALRVPAQQDGGDGIARCAGNELNYFRQLYVENSGQPGDLRVSEVYAGDPAVKGSIFVHERE